MLNGNNMRNKYWHVMHISKHLSSISIDHLGFSAITFVSNQDSWYLCGQLMIITFLNPAR